MLGHIFNNIILLNLNEFDNIGIDFYINLFFFFLALVVIAVAFVYEYSRGVMHLMVKQLIRHEANDKDSAKKLSDLGLHSNRVLKFMLSRNAELRKIVKRLGEPEIDYEGFLKLSAEDRKKVFSIDFETEAFYIREDNKDRAEKIVSSYVFSLPRFIAFAVFVILIWGCVAAFSFEIFSYINSIIIPK